MPKTQDELNQIADQIQNILLNNGVEFPEILGILQGLMIYYSVKSKCQMADLLLSCAAGIVTYQEQLELEHINDLFQKASNAPKTEDDDGSGSGGPPEGTLLN
jgi:hypothetical protein